MVSAIAVYMTMFATLAGVLAFAVVVSRKMEIDSRVKFLSAKNSQTAMRLGWSLFSAATGCWTLFSFPEIGVLAGAWGIIGYTLSSLLGLVVLSLAGPYCRVMLGEGMTLADFIYRRFGRVMQVYVACIAIFFQFIALTSELTCVGDLVQLLAPQASPVIPILGVAVVTNTYLVVGGLRASLTANVVQGMGVVTLVLVVCTAIFCRVDVPARAWTETQLAAFTSSGFEVLVTLCIAVTASNLFQTGYWLRVFAANDDAALKRGCWFAVFITVPFTVMLAFAGMVSFLSYPEGVYLFSVLVDMGAFWQVLIAMAIASLASAVSNSLQLGIVAELVTNFPSVNLFYARSLCGAPLLLLSAYMHGSHSLLSPHSRTLCTGRRARAQALQHPRPLSHCRFALHGDRRAHALEPVAARPLQRRDRRLCRRTCGHFPLRLRRQTLFCRRLPVVLAA
jgi:solute:Na+ symporter, SSS family